jgi:UDP-N-acetyl-D-glucosamine dehydrogenase
VKTADCVVIVTDHTEFDYKTLVADASLIVDTRNALRGVVSDKVFRL